MSIVHLAHRYAAHISINALINANLLNRTTAHSITNALVNTKSTTAEMLQELFIVCVLEDWSDQVEILLKDDRVDPSLDDNGAIVHACANGHTELAELLLKDTRIDYAARQNEPIILAVCNGHAKIVRMLLMELYVEPADRSNQAINSAAQNNQAEIIKLLLEDFRVDPGFDNYHFLEIAIEFGNAEVISASLECDRLCSIDTEYFVQKAIAYDQPDIANTFGIFGECRKKRILATINSDLNLKEKQDYVRKLSCAHIRTETDLLTGKKQVCMVFKI